ncbi:MAG TPA: acyl-ACP thioesterase domain-containing protein [Thermodesulfobacteriota bacterium]|nr:acyl-ACP thioesterase domain-containing protein [Thermodesulfobacteriota bacterium]
MKTQMSQMKASWEDDYSISFHQVDTKNEVFLPVLWSFMQETAWHHANHLRLSYTDLMDQQYFWVLSRLSVQMEEYPRWGDRIRVKTWLAGAGRLFALRQFSIADLSDKILGTARSAWLVLDLKSRKPQKIEPLFKHLQHLFDHLPAEEPEKLPAPVRPGLKKSYEVRYSDIDIHHHVNNIKYIEWILDSVPLEMNRTHRIQTFEINFLAESSYEDVISIQTETFQESPPVFLHRVSKEGEGKELCRARTGWEKANRPKRDNEEKSPQ